MRCYEVSRKLVKSQPEVWAELEKAERLAELLGDDSIKITRAEPESTIQWEGSSASGSIEISSSGWGTQVVLKTEVAEPEAPAVPEVEVAEPEAQAPPEPEVAQAEVPELKASEVEVPEVEVPEVGVPEVEVPEADGPRAAINEVPEQKLSLWKRIKLLFTPPESAPPPLATPQPNQAREDVTEPEPEPAPERLPEPRTDSEAIAQEPENVVPEPENLAPDPENLAPEPDARPEAQPEAQLEAVDHEQRMRAMLDHLGSAHKRPFVNS